METAIEISEITKIYPEFKLDRISLNIPVGTMVGLIGQNGAGKSTLFKCILNLVKKDSGFVLLSGINEDTSAERIRRFVGYMPERLTFYEWMTVQTHIKFVSSFYESWDARRCTWLVERYELDPGKKVCELSMGMRKKLALVLALAHQPRLLVLDEPTAGLDPLVKHYFLQDLRSILDEGKTQAICLSSHNLDDIERVADGIAVLSAGRLTCHESKEKFLEGWSKVLFNPPPGQEWIAMFQGELHLLGGGRAMVVSREEPNFLIRRLQNAGADQIEVKRPNLQEIFVQVA